MNRKTFSLVTSLAILTSSLSPIWAAGKDFTYNNLNQNLPIKAPVDETKEVEEKIDLPLVTETLPDESIRNKYARIIFVPETKNVDDVMEYGKLKDESGNIIPVSKNYYTSAEKKYFYIGKDYYVLKSATWSDVLNYKEDGKLILPKLEVENNESDPEKKKIHKFLGWSLSNNLRDPFNLKKYKKVSDIGTSDTLEFKSRFENLSYFYGTKTTPIYDPDGYKVEEFSKRYNYNEFTSFSDLSGWRVQLSPNEKQKEFADPKDFPVKRIYFYFKKNSGNYKFGDYKPSIVNEKNNTFWYWYYDGAHGNIAWDSFDMYDNAREFKAIFINKFFRIPDNIDLEKLPLPEGIFVVKLEAENGYTVEGLTFTRNAVRGGVSLAEVTSIPKEPELIDENNVKYEGDVAWYDGYKKINNPSEFKINSDIVLTARLVRDYESEKFTPQVKKIEVNKDEDVTLEKLKSGIVNLPKNLDKIEIKTYPDTSEVGEGKATIKLIFTDTSSKEVVIPVKVINIIDAGIVTPVPEIKVEDIIKEEVPYNGEINLLDNIKNLPESVKVEDVSEKINTKISGTYTGKVKITFKDGSSRIVVIPVEVSEALASSYTPEIKTIEVNKDEDVTLEKLKSGIVNLPKNLDKIEIKTYPDTSEVGEGKATIKLIFTDTSSKEVVIPVKVINIIDAGIVTPVPEIKVEDIIKEESPYHGQINLLDNIKNLPDGAEVKDLSDPIDTKRPGAYTGKVRVIFRDGSSRIVAIPIEVSEALANAYTPQVKKIEVNKDELVTLEKLKKGITNLLENIKDVDIVENVDTSKVGEGKATLKLIFSDTSSKEVEIPIRIIEKISGGAITAIPTINNEDIIKEEVPYNGQINLLDNIKNLPDGAEVEDISDTISTKISGTYTGKVRVTFKDGSSRIVEIPIEVLAPMAEKFPVQNPVKTQVENLENLSSLEKSEIEEKVREANPQVDSIEVDDKGNVTLIYEDGSSNLINAEDVIILREKTPEEEEPEEKPREKDNKNPEEKPGKEGDKDPEEKQGEKDNKDPEENPKGNEEEDNKKTENKRDSWNDFPRYYARNHRTPTYKVETKITYKESKPQVNSKKFVINMKTGTYTTIEDGKTLERSMEVKPHIKDDRTFLPLRALADILDAKVIWNEGTRTASFTREGLTALIQIDGKKIVLSNGETIELESKALIINGRIYLPLVNVGQVFGLTSGNSLDGEDQDIEWDDMDKTVTINIK